MGSGFKDFTAGDVFTAADVDDYLMRQTIMTFADSSARDTALSGVLDEGMYAYLEDNDVLTFYDGSAWLYRPGLLYEGTLTQAFTALEGPTNLTIDTEVKDAGTIGSVGSATLTAPQKGLYVVQLSGSRTAGTGKVDVTTAVTTGDSHPQGSTLTCSSATVVQMSNTMQMDASDVVTLRGTEADSLAATISLTVRLFLIG